MKYFSDDATLLDVHTVVDIKLNSGRTQSTYTDVFFYYLKY